MAESTQAVYEVGPSLRLELVEDGALTRVIAHGLPGALEHSYRLEYRSTLTEANGSLSYVRAGGNWTFLPLPLASITAPIEYWMRVGDQVSPVQVWTPTP